MMVYLCAWAVDACVLLVGACGLLVGACVLAKLLLEATASVALIIAVRMMTWTNPALAGAVTAVIRAYEHAAILERMEEFYRRDEERERVSHYREEREARERARRGS